MIQKYRPSLNLIKVRVVLCCGLLLLCSAVVYAQDTGGALVGGAGIFRPKNPEAKRPPQIRTARRVRRALVLQRARIQLRIRLR
jgi:hypothetical protein